MENLYLLSGDDDYEKEKFLENIKAKFAPLSKGINYVQIDKDNMDTLEQELSTYSFFGGDKLIVVKLTKNSSKSEGKQTEKSSKSEGKQTEKSADGEEQIERKDWLTEGLEEQIRTKMDFITLVFVAEGTPTAKLSRIIKECGKSVAFEKNKPYELKNWVKGKFSDEGVMIDNSSVDLLLEICGNDKVFLNNEIDKLVNFAGESKSVSRDMIDKMCIKTSEIIIFDLTDSMGKKNVKLALKYLDELLENKEPIQKIMIMVTKHFKTLLLAKVALSEKKDIVRELNLKPYPAKKYSEQSRNFSKEELIEIVKKLSRLDIDSKLGKIDLKIGLQKIICM